MALSFSLGVVPTIKVMILGAPRWRERRARAPSWRERRARAPHVCASLRQAGLHPLNEYHILDMIKMPMLGTHKVHSTWLPTVSHDPIYKSLHPIKIEMQRILIGAILLSPLARASRSCHTCVCITPSGRLAPSK